MGLASLRVQHGRPNITHTNMNKYLRYHTLLKEISILHHVPKPRRHKTPNHGIGRRLPTVYMGQDLTDVAVQQHFLHPEIRIARVELLDLLCNKLEIPCTLESYRQLQCLRWYFGQSLVMANGVTYWATDSYYMGQDGSRRRDVFLIQGKDRETGNKTAYSCEAIVFIQIQGFKQFCQDSKRTLPLFVADEIDKDTLNLVLGRWLTPHPTTHQRDSESRPICPGPLQHNHCLWMYSQTPRPRKIMVEKGKPSRAFEICRDMFGSSQAVSDRRWDEEKRAYYTFLLPSNIVNTTHMTREYVSGSETLAKSGVWLESVTLV